MIAKISSSENLAGALGYNFKKVVSGEASVLLAEGLYVPPLIVPMPCLKSYPICKRSSLQNIARYKGQG